MVQLDQLGTNISRKIQRVNNYLSIQTLVTIRNQFQLNTRNYLQHTNEALIRSPYLFILYFIIILVDVAPQLFNQGQSPENETFAAAITLFIMIMFANAFVYIEVKNTFTTDDSHKINNVTLFAFKRLPKLVAVGILYVIISLVGFVFFLFPGIYISVRYLLAQPAAIIDNTSICGSFEESRKAMSGKMTYVYLLVALITLPVAPTLVLITYTSNTVGTILTIILFTITATILQTLLAIIYLSNKEYSTIEYVEPESPNQIQ